MLLGFLIIFIAKKEGVLLHTGKILNVSVIYSMLTTSALLPFMRKLWNNYSSVSVLMSLLIYGLFLLIIPLILLPNEQNVLFLLLSMFVFMLSTLLMQHIQSQSVANERVIIGSQLTANLISIYIVVVNGWLITGYFLPHYLLLLVGLIMFPFHKRGVSFRVGNGMEFIKSFIRYSVIISVTWPLTFYLLREYFLGRSPMLWDDVEYVLRICLSVVGLNASVILHYNWGMEAKTFVEVRNRSLQLLAFSIPLFIVGYLIALFEVSFVDRISIVLIFISYSLRVLSLLPSYILMNRNYVKFVVFTELGSNLTLVICLILGLDTGVVIFGISTFLLILVNYKCKKVS